MLRTTILAASLLVASLAAPAQAAPETASIHISVAALASEAQFCCTADELKVLADLNYLARVALKHTGDAAVRLYALNQLVVGGTWRGWADPDKGYLLSLMMSTPDGKYPPHTDLIKRFGAIFGVTPQVVAIPVTTPPIVTVPPAPPPVVTTPPTAGVIEAEVRRIVREELAKLPAGAVGSTVSGDLVVLGQLCVGKPCDPAVDHAVQIRRDGAAEIYLSSNEGGLSPQFGVRKGISVISGGGDLGLRLIHNAAWSRAGTMIWGDPFRPVTILAFDSQGTLSLSQDMPGTVYGSAKAQHWVFRADYNRKLMAFTSMLPGWRMCVGWSTNTNDFQNLWCPEVGNR